MAETQTITLAHESIAALRTARGETLEAFGKLVGVGSKGRMSEIERGVCLPTAEQALAIEALSEGCINASDLNPIIAKARGLEVWAGASAGHDASDTAKTDETSPGKRAADFPAASAA